MTATFASISNSKDLGTCLYWQWIAFRKILRAVVSHPCELIWCPPSVFTLSFHSPVRADLKTGEAKARWRDETRKHTTSVLSLSPGSALARVVDGFSMELSFL
jgi:hypothetical protein